MGNGVNRRKAIKASLHALKSAGTEGIMIDVWWGLVETGEREAPSAYHWGGYAELLEMAKKHGLKGVGSQLAAEYIGSTVCICDGGKRNCKVEFSKILEVPVDGYRSCFKSIERNILEAPEAKQLLQEIH